MPSLGPLEVLVLGVIALIVFGPQRLPEIARTVGRTLAQLRDMAADVRTEFESGMNLNDIADEPETDPETEPEAEPGNAATEPGEPAGTTRSEPPGAVEAAEQAQTPGASEAGGPERPSPSGEGG